jgi:predicted nicotinamide N-methyase
VPGIDGLRLHLADDVLSLWRAVGIEMGDPDAPLPYWAFAWAGGLALGRYLREHPEIVAGRSVLDLGTGSGLCAIVAADAGAASVVAVDIDPFAAEAARLNARQNRVRIDVVEADLLDGPPPAADVILAADCWYEARLADRATRWLSRAAEAGSDVLVGDPGRRYLPVASLVELATYEVRTTTELEDLALKTAGVHRFLRPTGTSLRVSGATDAP